MKEMFVPQNESQIYSIISQESIFLLCGIRVEYNRVLGNPFRSDKHRTSVSFYNRTNLKGQQIIYMNDFAHRDYRNLTAFKLYIKTRNLQHYSFYQQYIKLTEEINDKVITTTTTPNIEHYETYKGKEIVLYQIKEKEYPHHREYLLEYGIDLDLIPEEKKYIRFVDHVLKYYPESNTPTRTVFYTGSRFPIFGYIFPSQSIKFYVPANKNFGKLMFGNASKDDVYGSWADYDSKCPTLITKSGKDRLTILSTLKKINFQHKINILAPNGEGMIPQLFSIHKMISTNKTLVWFDNDDPGKAALDIYSRDFGFSVYHNNEGEPKDPSDFYKQLGQEAFIERLFYVLSLHLNLP